MRHDMQKTIFKYRIYDDSGELFRIVKTKWERDKLVNTYKGFTCIIEKQVKPCKIQIVLESLGECLF